ncbi:hypothetical protein [Halorhabdus sp. CUG00001]|uniref:hypothetical protein n=1 Tax=Halorhabdus sp. CUG00001 TaxID=2600297 RepID=UPI00131EBDF7|nr:hypothetical protein [Halorhabdus sp. CUG00001]
MKWRCPQCGKPHERNDPPCDNCGHHNFERAVVPEAPNSDRESFVWVCAECGRQHQRNNPPCARCGHGIFEKQPLEAEEIDLSTRGYLDLIGRVELAAIGVLIGLLAVGALAITGVVTVPGLTPQGPPTVENVPGNATAADGLSLGDVETAYLAGLNDRRGAAGSTPLERAATLDAVATYYNQHRVKSVYGDGTLPARDELEANFAVQCRASIYSLGPVQPNWTSVDSPAALGETLATDRLVDEAGTVQRTASRTGIDMHRAPDGTLFVTQVIC